PEEADGAPVVAARVSAQVTSDTHVGFAFSQGAKGLVGELQGASGNAFSIAPRAGGDTGFTDSSEFALAVRQRVGDWGLTVSAESGQAWLAGNRRVGGATVTERERRPTATFSLAADRQFGALDTNVAVSWLTEEETILGGHFNPALGFRGAQTLFLDGEVAQRFGLWRLGGAVRYGLTRPRGSAQIASGSQLTSEAWSFDVSRAGLTSLGDTLGLRISQPLRVTGGALSFDLPIAYDYATETPILGRQSLNLSPEGREIMTEIAWGAPMLFGYARASVFHRSEPGHISGAPEDVGGLVSFYASF
ncbi:MAG: peptidase S8, partial [Pseudomonadota bacterium]